MLDKIRVIEGMPWCFDNHLVLLKDYDGSVQASKVSFSGCPFWVHIYNFPFNRMNQETA